MYESDLVKIATLPGFQFSAEKVSFSTSSPSDFEVANSSSNNPEVFADTKPDVLVETSDSEVSIGSGDLASKTTLFRTRSTEASSSFAAFNTASTATKNVSLSLGDANLANEQQSFESDMVLKIIN